MNSFFKFEDKGRDFPFYKHNPRMSNAAWLVLLLLIPISFLAYGLISVPFEFAGSVMFCLMLLVPLLYFSNWDYSLMFHKPTIKEIGLGIAMFACYMIYSYSLDYILTGAGAIGTDAANPLKVNIELIISLVFSLMAEELVKFIPLMFLMRVFYKFSENRKLSIVLSSALVMIGFGLLHYDPGIGILSALLFQGLGTIFEIFAYIKTKNIFIPYISHLLTDVFIMSLILFGFV